MLDRTDRRFLRTEFQHTDRRFCYLRLGRMHPVELRCSHWRAGEEQAQAYGCTYILEATPTVRLLV